MVDFTLYNKDTAPSEKARETLAAIEEKYGANMNIFAHMSESPLPAQLYKFGQDLANAEATLNNEEVNIVQLATSVENRCEFCVPAHSTLARKVIKTDDAVIDAIREGRQGPNARINALVEFTQSVTANRGHVGDEALEAFLNAGFTKEQIFEVVTIVSYKVVTNYTSAIAGTKPNEAFEAESWSPNDLQKAA